MDIKLSFEQQKKVVDSLKTNQVTKEAANERLQSGNQEMENKWKDKTYLEHEEQIEKEYYPLWKRQDKYREKLDSIPKTHVEGALEGSFEAQEQPEEKSYWKSRKKERTKIEEYKTAHAETKAHFDKNTVREMNELDKYRDYHNDYFRNREDQNVLKEAYVLKDQDTKLVKEWRNGILLQKKKFTLALGKEEGPAAELKKTVIETIYGNQTEYSREQEMDEGLRAFFSMTKKGFFRTKQLGLLGTETRSERKDGFEYNKRLLRVYTQGSDAQKAALMDELADKLLNFNLTPQMFTNKYMAKNMLQMQRYTDMLKGFVTLSKYNPGYLDVLNKDAAHTSPEKAALIRSRIILMAPIMENFMQQHAAYFGYKKRKGVTGRNLIDASASNFNDEESYNAFVKQTWEKIKLAYNSTADFLGDFAEAQLEGILKNTESQASKNREDRKLGNQDADQDDSIFGLKYDVDGERAKRLLSLRNRISSNPQIYDIFGSELERLFNRANEMARHLDELETRSESLKKMQDDPEVLGRSGIDKFGNMWKTYVKRETDRLDAECVILREQLEHYDKTVSYFTDQKLDVEKLELPDPTPEVSGVLEYEGLNHIFEIQKAAEYNDLLYKTLDFYDFDKFDSYEDGGKTVKIEDIRTKYNYTLLKRGMERARKVNRMVDGKTTVDIRDASKLNNFERRSYCIDKYNEYAGKVKKEPGKYKYSAMDVVTTDIEELTKDYDLTGEMDITKDETYEKYFRVKSIADMADKLDKDPTGKDIAGYERMSAQQKEELYIRASLFRDYFRRWEGKMQYTRSEAYEFLYDTDDMQGNNEIIVGIDKHYRKNTFSEMLQKVSDRYEKETDDKVKEKLGELKTFLSGMVLENDYDAKAVKEFGKDAYEAYKASYLLKKKKEAIKKTYIQDLNTQKIEGIEAGEQDEEKLEQKVEEALAIQNGIERYIARQKEELGKYGAENVTSKNVETLNIFDSDMKTREKEKGAELTQKEKAEAIRAHYERYVEIVRKMDETYCGDVNILENLDSVLADLKFARDFDRFLRANKGENHQLLLRSKGFGIEESEALDKYSRIVKAVDGYVQCFLLDHGIQNVASYTSVFSRNSCKRSLIAKDPRYFKDFVNATGELKKKLSEEKEKDAKDQKIREELQEVEELYKKQKAIIEEEERLEGKTDEAGDRQVHQTATTGEKSLKVRRVNPYETRYNELKSQLRTEEDAWKGYQAVLYNMSGIYDEKVKLEETKEGKRVDYITDNKEKNLRELKDLLHAPALERSRNYVEELFKFIEKNAEDKDLTKPENLTELLQKAKNAGRFRLSAGARREAGLRLEQYSRSKTAMRDFYIWRNTQIDNELLKERAKIFGNDAFMEKNVDKVRTVMDSIAEANASVNDMQTPEFLDSLKDTLEIKGIDERQFMFLMRRHHVGTSGLANTLKDAERAERNKEKAGKYLTIETRDDFLLQTAKEVLEIGDILKEENLNEEYILKHFEECYFTANRLMAFQQLYYGERDRFKAIGYYNENRDLMRRIDALFDKGHGEPYALYYNVVMSIANKYGVSSSGALNFGLPMEEVERLRDAGAPDAESSRIAEENLKKAELKTDQAFETLKAALRRDKMMLEVQSALDASLAGVKNRSRYGLDGSDEMIQKLNNFYNEHDKTEKLAGDFYKNFKDYGKNNPYIVKYTQTDFFTPQFMFFMAKDQAFDKAQDKVSNIDTTIAFQNLYTRDRRSVGKNLNAIDRQKCNRALGFVQALGLDTGKLKMSGKDFAYNEEWLDKNFCREFYEDIINAQNLCMMFEMDGDFMQLDIYENEVEKRKSQGSDEFVSIYEGHAPMLEKLNKEQDALDDELSRADLKRVRKKKALDALKEKQGKTASGEPAPLEEEIRKASAELEEAQAEYDKAMKKSLEKGNEIVALEEKMNEWQKRAGMADYGLVTKDKLTVLKAARTIFSDGRTRFIVSTFFNYVSAYMLKKGIRMDGVYTNQKVYEELLKEGSLTDRDSQKAALDFGEKISTEHDKENEALFNKQLEFIETGAYLEKLKELQSREKTIEKEKAAMEKEKRKQYEQSMKEDAAEKKKEEKLRQDILKTIEKKKAEANKQLIADEKREQRELEEARKLSEKMIQKKQKELERQEKLRKKEQEKLRKEQEKNEKKGKK